MTTPVYNSYDPFYKTPFGAVAAGQPVRLRIVIPHEERPMRPILFLMADGQDRWEGRAVALRLEEQRPDGDVFGCTVTVEEPGLYFYFFDLYRDYQKVFEAEEGGVCVVTTDDAQPYQLTVYDPAFRLNEDLTGGVMYQIFPDRFCEGKPDKTMPFADRVYRTDKQNPPYYWPNEKPEGYLNMDYYGGDFAGIREKLPYLAGLGVTCIYMNPIFEAHSNHRYNTADYMKVDPVLGTNEEFEQLCADAHAHGIRILLDGVFSHTGSDSRYFNKEGRYPTRGAWQDKRSPYRSWFVFSDQYKCGYRSWWGFETLPEVEENDPSYREFICGENGVLRTWLRRGADGWRLDVADELPDDFIAEIRAAVKAEGEEKFLLGEVWEDATTKFSQGGRRKYFWGKELDTVMNYPWRTAILDFVRHGGGETAGRVFMSICEHYPPAALHTLMTSLGTHDTERAITALAGESSEGHDRHWQNNTFLTPAARRAGTKLLRLAMELQFFLPGNPCVYYGDEIAMEGYRDPFNRGYFDWEDRSQELRDTIRTMAAARKKCRALHDGDLRVLAAGEDYIALTRTSGDSHAAILVNRGSYLPVSVTLPCGRVLTAQPLHSAFSCTEE